MSRSIARSASMVQPDEVSLGRQSPYARKLSGQEAARYLGISESFLRKHRLTGDGPVYMKMGSRVVYDLCDLDAFATITKRKNTSTL